MGVFSFWGNRKQTENDVINLPEVFCLKLGLDDFIKEKALSFYEALLTQCYLRSENFPDDKATTLWNRYNMVDPILSKGVISLLATALVEKRTMAIAYDKATNVAYEALGEKYTKIYEDYEKRLKSDDGIFVNFALYYKTDLLIVYLALLFNALKASGVQLGLAQALKFKAAELRTTQANNSSAEWKTQGNAIVSALKEGRPVLIDKEDDIELTKLDISPVKNAIEFYAQLIAGEFNLTTSFVTGILTNGMNSTGEAELEFNENGIKTFFMSIFKPNVDELLKININFKTDNYRQTAELVKAIPYLESSEVVTNEQLEKFVKYALGEE